MDARRRFTAINALRDTLFIREVTMMNQLLPIVPGFAKKAFIVVAMQAARA